MKRHLITFFLALLLVAPALAQSPDFHGPADGPVFMALDRQGNMWATWAYRNGGEYDIALSQMVGQTWTFPELLGYGNGRDDLDPRVNFTPNGRAIIVWWQAETPYSSPVAVFSFLASGEWTVPRPLDSNLPGTSNPGVVSSTDDSFVYTMLNAAGEPLLGNIKFLPGRKPRPRPNGGSNGPDPMPTILQRRPPPPAN